MNNELFELEFDGIKNENIKPWEYSYYSHISLWWICSECDYSWNCPLNNKTNSYNTRGTNGCPRCAGNCPIDLEGYLSLGIKRGGIYLGIKINGKYKKDIPQNTNDNYAHWKCEKGHKFNTCYSSIRSGSWCPECRNKTEAKLHDFFKETYLGSEYEIKYQYKVDWCMNKKTGKYLPYDFMISYEDKKVIVELDGDQHKYQISNWASPEETRIRDVFKMKKAIENNFSFIRIYQMDVFKDKFLWRKQLINKISISKLSRTRKSLSSK